MFRRRIDERVKEAAPFLEFDRDPYIVLVDGELHWIIDACATSDSYPYSEHFIGDNFDSARKSVKTVVNPYNRDIDFYIYDEDDPIIQVWSRIDQDSFRSGTSGDRT